MMKVKQLCTPQHRMDLIIRDDQWTSMLYALISSVIFAQVGVKDDFYSQSHVRRRVIYLLPYYLLLLMLALPVLYIQIRLGQSRRQNILELFSKNMPVVKGVATSLLLVTYVEACMALAEATTDFHTQVRSPAQQLANVTVMFSESDPDPSTDGGGKSVLLTFAWGVAALSVIRGPSWFSKAAAILASGGAICLLVTLMTSQLSLKPASQIVPYGLMMSSSIKITDFMVLPPNVTSEHDDVTSPSLATLMTTMDVWTSAAHRHMSGLMLWSGLLPSLGRNTETKQFGHNCWPWLIPFIYQFISPLISWFFPAQEDRFGEFTATIRSMTLLFYSLLHQALVLVLIQECIVRRFSNKLRDVQCPEIVLPVLCCLAICIGGPYAWFMDVPQSQVPAWWYWYQWLLHNFRRLSFFLIVLTIPPIVASFARLHEFDIGVKTVAVCVIFAISASASSVILVVDLAKNIWYIGPFEAPPWVRACGLLVLLLPLCICVTYGVVSAMFASSGDTILLKLRNSFKPIISNEEALPLVASLGPTTTTRAVAPCEASTSRLRRSLSTQSSFSGISSGSVSSESTVQHLDLEVMVIDASVVVEKSDDV